MKLQEVGEEEAHIYHDVIISHLRFGKLIVEKEMHRHCIVWCGCWFGGIIENIACQISFLCQNCTGCGWYVVSIRWYYMPYNPRNNSTSCLGGQNWPARSCDLMSLGFFWRLKIASTCLQSPTPWIRKLTDALTKFSHIVYNNYEKVVRSRQ